MVVQLLIAFISIVFLAGCATTRQPSELNQLQIKVSQLERKLDDKDQEINDLKYEINEMTSKMDNSGSSTTRADSSDEGDSKSSITKSSSDDIIRVSVSAKEVQRALKKAGYYEGEVDGKFGAKSQKAVADFQKDHDLTSDGIVGQKTWNELKKYLD